MENSFKKLLTLALVIPVLAGCNQKSSSSSTSTDTGSSDVSTDTGDTSTHSSTATPPKSFNEVLENNERYSIYFGLNDGRKFYHEINETDFYAYVPNGYGYALLDSDPDFTHFCTLTKNEVNSIILDMNGRNASSYDFDEASKSGFNTFTKILSDYSVLFKQDKENPWKFVLNNISPSKDFKSFFQLNEFAFCDYYEVIVGENGRITNFNAGETVVDSDGNSSFLITERLYLESNNLTDLYFYNDWVEKGSKINVTVMDYKTFYRTLRSVEPCYDYGEITAIVTAVDYDGSFYISNVNKIHGPIGMRVTPSQKGIVAVGDKVNVKGDIVLDYDGIFTANTRFVDAEVSVLGHGYPVPAFDEESIVDSYSPGVYAVQMLVRTPIYGGSIYNGYAYASNIPTCANSLGDTVVELICPAYHYESTGKLFSMELRIPFSYGEENINKILEECRAAGDYSKSAAASKPIFFQNIISYYSFERELSLNLYVLPNSNVSRRLNYVESIERDYGYENFPQIQTTSQSGFFHFGDNADWLIEDQYNIVSDEHAGGLFSFYQRATYAEVTKYFDDLISYGAVLLNIYSLYMTRGTRHYIFSYKDLYIDVMFEEYNKVITGQTQIFIYRAEKEIRCKNIQEKIDAVCGSYFSGEEFIILPNTNDCDYHLYNIPSFAGNEFGLENPLHIATLDILEDRYDELRQAYRDAGWKIYRNEDNKAYSYTTRGNTRVVYYKDNENGKKTFLDFGKYPKTDYTFLGCDAFANRVEIAIYEGDAPLTTQYTQSMNHFMTMATEYAPSFNFEWTLPSKYKAEYYSTYKDYFEVDYGYCINNDDVFIYPESNTRANIDELYNYVLETIKEHGYVWSFDGKQGVNYRAEEVSSSTYSASYIYIQKNYERGYVRMRSGMGGLDF